MRSHREIIKCIFLIDQTGLMLPTKRLYGVREQLTNFVKNGKPLNKSNIDKFKKVPKATDVGSLHKVLKILKYQYDGLIRDESGMPLNVANLTTKDLTSNSKDSKSGLIFKNLLEIKKVNKRPLDKRLLYQLLSVNLKSLMDKTLVTKKVENFLALDDSHERASYVLRLGTKKSVVAMNRVLEFLLKKKDVKQAFKTFNDCKKWGYVPNMQTFIILFTGFDHSTPWGKLSNDLGDKVIDLFKKIDSPQVSQFNALLGLLVKDFSNNQAKAWEIFDYLPECNLKPDITSFTIFLNGIKSYNRDQIVQVVTENIPGSVKVLKYYRLHNELITYSQIILNKVFQMATPPPLPSKDDIQNNTESYQAYKSKTKDLNLVNIDSHFLSVYLSCFINNFSRTGLDNDSSNYYYALLGLKQLMTFNSEIHRLFNDLDVSLEPSKTIKLATDFKLEKAKSEVVKNKEILDVKKLVDGTTPIKISFSNPNVVFPTSVKNKRRTLLNARPKPLIKTEINKFLMLPLIDGLVYLDKPDRLLKTVWYLLQEFGGIEFSKLPELNDLLVEVKAYDDYESPLDIKLIENFMYKIHKVYLKKSLSSKINIQLVKYLINSSIKPVESTYSALFAILNDELTYFLRTSSPKSGSTPLDESQLEYILTNLLELMKIIPKTKTFIAGYSRIIDRLHKSGLMELKFYKSILLSGIVHYQEPEVQKLLSNFMKRIVNNDKDEKLRSLTSMVLSSSSSSSSSPNLSSRCDELCKYLNKPL